MHEMMNIGCHLFNWNQINLKEATQELFLWPKEEHIIRLKWVHRNIEDEEGNMVNNKSRLLAKRYKKEEGIDFDKSFASVHNKSKCISEWFFERINVC